MSHGSLPSKERLVELREKGKFPFSLMAVRASVMLAVVITCVVSFRIDEIVKAVGLLCEGQQRESIFADLRAVAILLCGGVCGSAIIMALFQTRGRVSSPQFTPWSRAQRDLEGVSPRNIGGGACAVVAAVITVVLTTKYFVGDLFLLFRREPQTLIEDSRAIMVAVSRVLIVVGVVLAILGVVGARIAFIFKHRSKDADLHKG